MLWLILAPGTNDIMITSLVLRSHLSVANLYGVTGEQRTISSRRGDIVTYPAGNDFLRGWYLRGGHVCMVLNIQ